MAAGIVDVTILDGSGAARTARFWSSDGTIDGVLSPPAVLLDGDGSFVDVDTRLATLATKSDSQIAQLTAIATAVADNTTPVPVFAAGREYETVAASQTAQVLGATGATGDTIDGVLVVPATTSPGNVILLDGSTSITIFAGGASSVSNLVPFYIPLNMKSVSGAWKLTTGANVSAIGVGDFT